MRTVAVSGAMATSPSTRKTRLDVPQPAGAVLIHHGDEPIQLVIDVVDTRRLRVQPARHEQGAENYDRDRIRCGDVTVSIRCGHKSVRGKARPGPAVCRPSAEFSDQEFGRA